MDHEIANKTQGVERYLLGEMPLEEREAFEEHYFSCAICAENVRTASAMAADMKHVLREGVPAPSDSWFSWLKLPVVVPACAALFLAAVVGYQNTVVLPELKAPRPIGTAVILEGQTRGGVPKVNTGDSLRFQISLDGLTAADRVVVELDGAAGQKIESGEVPVAANQPLDVYFPGDFGPGRYALAVREISGGKELARSSFEIANKENTQ